MQKARYLLYQDVACSLSKQHREHREDEDNFLARVKETIPNRRDFILGRPRSPLRNEQFWRATENDVFRGRCGVMDKTKITAPLPEEDDLRLCAMFHAMHDELGNDWNRTLCIGGLWIDVVLKERRFEHF